ncbi:MAG: hypothetical protein RIQ52_1798 [Pseudomonadota bacterium]
MPLSSGFHLCIRTAWVVAVLSCSVMSACFAEDHIRLDADQQKASGISVAIAGSGEIAQTIVVPGKVLINNDRIAHVIPRVAGVVREVRQSVGDSVRAGDVLAVIESMDIADARAAYLAAHARKRLAQASYRRKETLWREQITSEQVLDEARQALELAEVEERTAVQKLIALDVPRSAIDRLASRRQQDLSRYEIRAPLSGNVLERDMVLGEAIQPNVTVFLLGNLDTVWVDLNVYPRDLDRVTLGQSVRITSTGRPGGVDASVVYIRPVVSEETRAATVRVVLDNHDGHWQPGLFVSGSIEAGRYTASVMVPREAVMTVHNQTVVFVRDGDLFSARPVMTGQDDGQHVEIVHGLQTGEYYVTHGGFILKDEAEKNQ